MCLVRILLELAKGKEGMLNIEECYAHSQRVVQTSPRYFLKDCCTDYFT